MKSSDGLKPSARCSESRNELRPRCFSQVTNRHKGKFVPICSNWFQRVPVGRNAFHRTDTTERNETHLARFRAWDKSRPIGGCHRAGDVSSPGVPACGGGNVARTVHGTITSVPWRAVARPGWLPNGGGDLARWPAPRRYCLTQHRRLSDGQHRAFANQPLRPTPGIQCVATRRTSTGDRCLSRTWKGRATFWTSRRDAGRLPCRCRHRPWKGRATFRARRCRMTAAGPRPRQNVGQGHFQSYFIFQFTQARQQSCACHE
jgi:hypothetical protein